MKELFATTLAILLLIATDNATAQTGVAAQKSAGGKTEKELMKITNELTEASKRGDKKVFDKYFTDAYFSTNVDGIVRKRAEILESITPASFPDPAKTDFEDIQVVEYGNVALLSLRFNHREEINGRPFVQSYRVTDVFAKQDGQWKILSRHLSIIPVAKTAAKVDPAIYDAYVGQYEISSGVVYTITREGDKLMGQFTGNKTKFELLPENETTFFENGRRRQTLFVKDDKGQVSHIVQRLPDGQEVNHKKVK